MNALESLASKRSGGYESISEGSRIVWLAYDSWVRENGLSKSREIIHESTKKG